MRNARAKLLKTMAPNRKAYRALKKAYNAMSSKDRATTKVPTEFSPVNFTG